ncbi:MAG: FtsQ-type POTRA domain-containing protein [Lentisphaeria bacterium]|nr:FtsQ-type POTRA domain-containing protein [Candidatus Neomarinimicrobiota bacterium]MCF7842640.1 FtsQ-type POTRA domain-containing protein [Lentisphaeria bacterium]
MIKTRFNTEQYRGLLWSLVALAGFGLLGLFSSLYGEHVNANLVQRVTIHGNRILSTQRLESMLKPYMWQRLETIDLDSLQAQFLQYPLVKAVKVSRIYPDELQVYVREVHPIAYLQGSHYLSIDVENKTLPLPDYGMIYTMPIITQISNTAALEPNTVVADEYINDLVAFLKQLRRTYPQLYYDISEISYSEKEGLKVITSTNSTPVYLGTYHQLPLHIATLDAFIRQLDQGPVLPAYRYVDLRFANQVVVKERS